MFENRGKIMKKDKKRNNENDISQIGNVDQIREILFGSQSRELKDKFEQIEQTMNSLHNDMQKKMQQNQDDFNHRLTNELETISRKIKNITTQQQQEFADVRDSALKQDVRIQTSLEILEEELNAKNDQLKQQQVQDSNTLRNQMQTLQNEMVQTLNSKIAELGYDKLSRDDAANILMEAAMAMKGTSIDQQLSLSHISN